MINNLEVMQNLTEGTFVKITGMEVKNDNDIFVVHADYRIEGEYAVCHDERCIKKVKLNGELSSVKYNIVFLNKKVIEKNPNIRIEIVTDLKTAKKEVNNWLKGITDNEMVVTYERAENQEVKQGSIIRFPEGVKFGTFGEKYISNRTLWMVNLRDNGTISIKELGKKGQEISNGSIYGCSAGLTKLMIEKCEVLERIETRKGDINNNKTQVNEITENKTSVTEQTKVEEIEEDKDTITAEETETTEKLVSDYFNINQSRHTKKNIDIWVCKVKNKIPYDNFKELESEIKTLDGYYSKFVRGFVFEYNPVEKLNNSDIDVSIFNPEHITENKNIIQEDYPDIDINDIETYKISSELSKRENSVSMFRRNETDHNKGIQNILQGFNDSIIDALHGNSNKYIDYKAKEGLQRFKKKYYDIYVRMLTHRANNPSWVVTGRGGLNVNRYNKKQEQYSNMMGESVQICNDFKKHVSKIKDMIRTEQQKKLQAEIQENINSINELPKFKKIKVKINASAIDNIFNNGSMEITANELNGYFIMKNWGCWRVYNSEGNEIYSTKTTENLKQAQQWLIYHLSKLDVTA